ncbi:DNA polymerase III subunit delta' [Sphingomonas lutea]|uniref:DNA polymerase III subunit delta' n=1 Tax=Sphingomonas lutea TaxID=1045317 RepID=UPI00314563C6
MILGHDRAVEQFSSAWAMRKLHHAWLLAGPRGVGKARFARAAATRLLAEAAGPAFEAAPLDTPAEHPMARLITAESHPDMRWIQRLPREKGEGLARNISVKQVRELGEFLGLTPALSDWRAIVIDPIDELETSAANALLKILEEPPPNSLFLLVSHAPGRLLPTIRSRCRRLDFQSLDDDVMASILERETPDVSAAERQRVVAMSEGSAGRALAFAELGLAKLEDAALTILRQGDPTNGRRSDLAQDLGKKASAERYAAFLDLAPSLIAREARGCRGRDGNAR